MLRSLRSTEVKLQLFNLQ